MRQPATARDDHAPARDRPLDAHMSVINNLRDMI
jgi:hypothetical protein